ncbi:formate dehydrogenase subunit delta [Diaphorobacter caeni]|uniref:formate dehydrogenase subunit delta n=1 Tax=Diaphorobacter caeni TaxID=2784387 RepID=UPI00188E8B1F|nr:formate dehydrogenase subunit delta [Diaphorobacter caeni]MBF5007131.1 formate dehydrogenase subunit delta [Diaphorobacter caeni]
MDPKTLVQLANRIGEFFQAQPDREEALLGVATHIRQFWDPRMRRQLLGVFDALQTEGLSTIVADALHAHRALLQPADDSQASASSTKVTEVPG